MRDEGRQHVQGTQIAQHRAQHRAHLSAWSSRLLELK